MVQSHCKRRRERERGAVSLRLSKMQQRQHQGTRERERETQKKKKKEKERKHFSLLASSSTLCSVRETYGSPCMFPPSTLDCIRVVVRRWQSSILSRAQSHASCQHARASLLLSKLGVFSSLPSVRSFVLSPLSFFRPFFYPFSFLFFSLFVL